MRKLSLKGNPTAYVGTPSGEVCPIAKRHMQKEKLQKFKVFLPFSHKFSLYPLFFTVMPPFCGLDFFYIPLFLFIEHEMYHGKNVEPFVRRVF